MRYLRYRLEKATLDVRVNLWLAGNRDTSQKINSTRERNFPHTIILVDLDVISKLSSLSLNLDTVMKEFFKGRAIK